MKRVFLFFILANLAFSCYHIHDVEIEIPTRDPKLVVVSTLVPWQSNHKYLGVSVYSSRLVSDESPILPITNATINLFRNGVFFQELVYDSDERYRFYPINFPPMGGPIPGEKYRIEVNASGFDPVWAETSIPDLVEIIDVDIERVAFFDKSNRPVSKVTITFNDSPDKSNFYEVVLSSPGEDYIPTFYHTLHSFEPVIISEPYYPLSSVIEIPAFRSLLFNDRSFNGNTKQISYFYSPGIDIFAPQGQVSLLGDHLSVQLRNVTEEYYNHYTTLYLAKRYGEVNLFEDITQPINVFSNIVGGYGIFAGFNNSVVIKELDPLVIYID